MTEELKSAMREASKSLSAAIEDMADKVNAVLASRDRKMAARSVLADKLRKAASRKDLNWQALFDALCVKSRSEAVAALAAMIDPKGILTERERHILDMWPRYEGGEPVWFGDSVEHDGTMETVHGFKLYRCGPAYLSVVGIDTEKWLRIEDCKSVKRPAPKVLDADGVEIRAGDTVWFRSLSTGDRMRKATVTGFGKHSLDGPLATLKDEMGWTCHIDPKKITHVQPDSWERLEEDAEFNDETGIVGGNLDIVRRAKALAGMEVGR